jgi:hypothetical protein
MFYAALTPLLPHYADELGHRRLARRSRRLTRLRAAGGDSGGHSRDAPGVTTILIGSAA